MNTINPFKASLTIGGLLGCFHLFWAALVAAGLAQPFINFVFWIHFIKPVYIISSFSFGTALILVAVTSVIGFAMGLLVAALWNSLQKQRA